MPSIDVVMRRSLRRGLLDVLATGLRPTFEKRDTIPSMPDFKTAISSWDNCMSVGYCKWPVITLIVIACVVIFSVTWCIVRCACCGLSCCCECCYCLKCCGNCCGCCDPPRSRKHKYLDEPYVPPHHQENRGYTAQTPMAAEPTLSRSAVPAAEPPQYAEFEVSSSKSTARGGDDALPEMPTWADAKVKRAAVEDEVDGVELAPLKKPEASTAAAGGAGPTTGTRSPHTLSPFPQTAGGYGAGGRRGSPPDHAAYGYQQPHQGNSYYNNTNNSNGNFNDGGLAFGPGGRHSPQHHQQRHQQYADGYGAPSDGGEYGAPRHDPSFGRQFTASPQPYGGGGGDDGYSAWPQQQQHQQHAGGAYGHAPRAGPPSPRDLSPRLQNNAGFDFNSGYARMSPSPQAQPAADSYPGFRPYQPPGASRADTGDAYSGPRRHDGW